MNELNGYTLTRDWYNFKFENLGKVRHIHSDLYFYIVDTWNRFGQKQRIGLPSKYSMDALGIGNYNTYKKALDDLVEWGFIEMVSVAKNQYSSCIIALCKSEEATAKALDKAHVKASEEATANTTAYIYKQGTREQLNNETGTDTPVSISQDSLNTEKKKKDVAAAPPFNFKKELMAVGANEELVIEWLRVRKAKDRVNSKITFDKFMRELNKSKRDINKVLRVCVEKGWARFEAEWQFPSEHEQPPTIVKETLFAD
jgi:hypothetical protein